jgi:hypothetical protein
MVWGVMLVVEMVLRRMADGCEIEGIEWVVVWDDWRKWGWEWTTRRMMSTSIRRGAPAPREDDNEPKRQGGWVYRCMARTAVHEMTLETQDTMEEVEYADSTLLDPGTDDLLGDDES